MSISNLNMGQVAVSTITGAGYMNVLTDGNTVGWYASDESSTITKNASNYVCGWGDKLTYSEGPELIDQANWYKLSYWNSPSANWSQDGTSLYSNGTGSCNKTNFMTVGHSYKITITMSYDSGAGEIRHVNDNAHTNRMFGANATGTFTWIVPAWGNTTLYNVTVSSWLGHITAMSVKEVQINTLVNHDLPNSYLPQWSSDGIIFDGTNDYMITGALGMVQPEMIYMVMKNVTWTTGDRFFDGTSVNTGDLISGPTSSPQFRAYAGSYSGTVSDLTINTFGIIRVLFNGASSKVIVNASAPVTGDFGAANMGGFLLGAAGNVTAFGRITAKEIIIRKVADTSDNEALIYNYLKAKYSL